MSPKKRPFSARKYKTYSSDSLRRALDCIKNEGISVKRAANLYNINRSTLINHLKNHKCGPVGRPTVLTQEEERHIVHILIKLAEWGFGMDRFQLKILVQDYLKRIDRRNVFKDGIPGKDWIAGFEKRWKEDLRRRVAQNLPRNRAEACSKEVLQDFYIKINDCIERLQLQRKPQNIFNCDETGLQTDCGVQKILCRKGSANPHKVVGSTTKSTYTILVCCSATGEYLPPYINFKGLHLYSTWCQNGPENAVYNCSPSGWMEADQFFSWFKDVFVKATADLEGSKILIYDGHNSHITVPLIETALQNNIELLCLPAHTSHVLQPLDVGVFKSLKVAWRNVLKDHYHRSGCKSVDKVLFPSLVKKTIEAGCFSRANAIGGFSGAGIYPIDRDKILEKSIESTVFDEPLQENTAADKPTSIHLRNTASDTNNSTPVSSTSSELFSPKQLEESLLSVLQRQEKPISSGKRTKVRRKFAECLTSAEILERMTAEANMKQKEKEKQTEKKLKQKVKNIKTTKTTANRSKVQESSEEESDGSLILESDTLSETFSDMEYLQDTEIENKENEIENKDNETKVTVGAWVLVKFKSDKGFHRLVHYIGQVTEAVEFGEEIVVNFLRKKEKCFMFPEKKDEAILPVHDVVRILPEPYIRRGMHSFNCDVFRTDKNVPLIVY